MNWIIFFAYLIFFYWLVSVIPFFRKSELRRSVICGLFLLKILAGIAYFQFYSLPANKATSDTWKFYNRSIPETDALLQDPVAFAQELFVSKYENTGGLFSDKASYWNDVKDELMVKLMAIVNVFTLKNYYANIIWFNFFFFWGLIAFYRLMLEIYHVRHWLMVVSVFLLPSFLFWCSGIHKDGFLFSAIGLLLYSFHHLLQNRKIFQNLVLMLLCLVFIFFLRNYLVFVLVPCLVIGTMIHFFQKRKLLIVLSMLVLGALFIFTGKYLHPSLNIPRYIVDKQSQFKKLEGGSVIKTPVLSPTFSSFVTALPSAIDVGLFRPHLNEKGVSSKGAAIEIILFWLLLTIILIRNRPNNYQLPVVIICWLFAISTLLIIGYTVNFSGAVVRYRSLLLPLLLAPMVGSMLSKHIKKNNI